jgi:hypothetical protein
MMNREPQYIDRGYAPRGRRHRTRRGRFRRPDMWGNYNRGNTCNLCQLKNVKLIPNRDQMRRGHSRTYIT